MTATAERRVSDCVGKVGFGSFVLAKKATKRGWGKRHRGRREKREPYRCRWCGNWHIGHKDST